MATLACEACQTEVALLWTYRDPAIPAGTRYHGHGLLNVCAECLFALGGPDYRGQSVGHVLAGIEARRRR